MSRASALFSLVALALASLLQAGLCEARLVNVWYDHSAAPAWNSRADAVAAIQSSLREWELHNAQGQLTLQWRGVIGAGQAWPPESINDIVIYWDPDEGSDVCAKTCRQGVTCFDVGNGRIALTILGNGNLDTQWNRASFRPGGFGGHNPWRCGSLRGTLNHELGHLLRDTPTHWSTSVLTTYYNRDSVARNLWEEDLYASSGLFSLHTMAFEVDVRSPSSTARTGQPYSPAPGGARLTAIPAIETGDGENSMANYAVAFGGIDNTTNSRGIAFWRGDGVSWQQRAFLSCASSGACPNNQTTNRRMCVASSLDGARYVMLWAAPTQANDGNANNDFAGTRQVMVAESANRGANWTVGPLTGVFTRSGVSCAFDPTTNRLVALFARSDNEALQVTFRPMDGGAWSTPQTIDAGDMWTPEAGLVGLAPSSADAPDVSFDRFSGSTTGFVAWFDSIRLQVLTARLEQSSGRYHFVSAAAAGGLVGDPTPPGEMLRSNTVIDFEQSSILLLALNPNYQLRHNFWRFSLTQPTSAQNSGSNSYFAAPNMLRQYSDAASARTFFQDASISRTINHPD